MDGFPYGALSASAVFALLIVAYFWAPRIESPCDPSDPDDFCEVV